MTEEVNVGGRPTDYKEEYNEQARKLCLLGYIDKELADFFGVCKATLNNWKQDHNGFLDSINAGKDVANAEVADSLYNRALGYSHPEVHVSNYQGEITLTPLIKHYPPDTQAASLFLRNRRPDKWRDTKGLNMGGPDGEPIDAIEIRIVDHTKKG